MQVCQFAFKMIILKFIKKTDYIGALRENSKIEICYILESNLLKMFCLHLSSSSDIGNIWDDSFYKRHTTEINYNPYVPQSTWNQQTK